MVWKPTVLTTMRRCRQDYGVDYDNGREVIITPLFYKMAQEQGTVLTSFSRTWDRRLAYFANANYSYKGRYSFNVTGRYDGSNQLGKSRSARWLPTWNVSGAWNAHEEEFFKKWMERTHGAMSNATLRLSYSLVGERGSASNALPIYMAYQPFRPLANDAETGIELYSLGNSELTYEKKKEFNVGVDLGFINNRINLVSDFYWRKNYDLMGYISTEKSGGESQKFANVAAMRSHGIEFTLSTKNIMTKDLTWTSDLTFSYATTKITDLKSRSNVLTLVSGSGYARQGYPVRALFSIPFAGLNDEGIPQTIDQNGNVVTTNVNFQNFEQLDYLKYEGPTDPTTTGGFNNTVEWKNWRLNVFFTYSFGNVLRLDPVFSAAYSDMDAMPKEFKNRWVEPGDEKVTNIPTIASTRQYHNDSQLSYAYNAYNYSTARVAKGDFIRLKDISLTYEFSKTLISHLGLSTLSLKLDATNLFLLYADDKLNGQDPEYVNAGGVASPTPKQFTFTLRLGI